LNQKRKHKKDHRTANPYFVIIIYGMLGEVGMP
jgi:hypothetical protein